MRARVLFVLACVAALFVFAVPAAQADGDLWIWSIDPQVAGTGTTVNCVVRGTFYYPIGLLNFAPEISLVQGSTEIDGYNESFFLGNGTAVAVTFSIPYLAPGGRYDVHVEQTSGFTTYSDDIYQAFLVTQRPIITSLSPSSLTAGQGDVSLTINGANFIKILSPLPQQSEVQVNGTSVPTTVDSANKLTATVRAAMVANVGTLQVVVVNTGTKYVPETSSDAYPLPVKAPAAPVVTSITPTTVWAGYVRNDIVLTLTGSSFVSGARIALNGTDKATTTYVSATKLTLPLTAADIATAGTVNVGAKNPPFPPGTASATTVPLAVQAETSTPVVTISGGDSAWHNSPVALTFSATDSQSGLQKIQYMSAPAVPAWTDGTSYTVPTSAQGAITVNVQALDWCNNAGVANATVNIDTTQPGTQALGNVSVKKGKSAKLKYRVTEPAGLSPTADVVIKVNSGSSTVKTLTVNDATVNADRTASFTCNLKKGSYTWYVYATDLAGNTQANVAKAKLTVK